MSHDTRPAAVPSRRDPLFDLEPELARARRVLERVPVDRATWRPHEKSTPLGVLAAHLATLPRFITAIVRQDGIDLAPRPPTPPEPPASSADLLRSFDDSVAAARSALAGLVAGHLAAPFALRRGSFVFMEGTREELIRTMVISHIVHHRAQLGVYLRLLDVPVPAIYGPSADERPG